MHTIWRVHHYLVRGSLGTSTGKFGHVHRSPFQQQSNNQLVGTFTPHSIIITQHCYFNTFCLIIFCTSMSRISTSHRGFLLLSTCYKSTLKFQFDTTVTINNILYVIILHMSIPLQFHFHATMTCNSLVLLIVEDCWTIFHMPKHTLQPSILIQITFTSSTSTISLTSFPFIQAPWYFHLWRQTPSTQTVPPHT